ncbi:sensor histidine kinase [Yinghuangia soli]|uniref:histidine kinase n=1 Tax=Yinghuangia soli TaxID=2908204 RepID=A0AA41Q2K5_9ACTN|nr:histidine kinase [Yinghuangia soli]MCF2530047.1 histidine kinase [Yinghuangia soli]
MTAPLPPPGPAAADAVPPAAGAGLPRPAAEPSPEGGAAPPAAAGPPHRSGRRRARVRAFARRIPDARLRMIAAVLACTAVVGTAVYVPYHYWLAQRAELFEMIWSDVALGAAWPVVGAFVVRVRPRNPVGWLLLIPAALSPYLIMGLYAAQSELVADDPLPLADFAGWIGAWGFGQYFVVIPLLLLYFPDGHLPSPRWRFATYYILTAAGVAIVAAMFRDGSLDVSPAVDNPWGIPGAGWLRYVLLAGSFAALIPGTVIGVAALVVRSRRVVGVQRTQLQWLVLAGLVLMVCFAVPIGATGRVTDVFFAIGLLAPPAGIAVAMLRHRMFDVVVVLNRTIVSVVMTVLLVGLYAALVLGVGRIAPTSTMRVAAVAVVALLAAYGRGVVQKLVDRWLFGHRHDPYAVVARVGRHVAPASEPVEALQRLVDALRRALRLPYVAFRSTGGKDGADALEVVSGSPVAGWRTVPAQALGQDLGELHVGLRSGDERWTPEEQAAVEEVAARAATLAYAAGLVADVARSRARIVVAREEERRRLRADLHDGVGPALAGTAHQLDALARRIEAAGQPELAGRARSVRDRLRQTVTDLRSVVHGLRPPILDQLGLAGALRDLLAGYETPHCTVDLGPGLDTLPAAVEVAAYAIAAEAVANAVRHSGAGELTLHARIRTGSLVLEVHDNGCGMPVHPHAGVGLRSMGERAGEVGGRVDILPHSSGGTIVQATLPGGPA